MHHADILIGHFREMVGNWPVASCYFALCSTTSGAGGSAFLFEVIGWGNLLWSIKRPYATTSL